ncbi:MAG: methylamine dehydrogenase accessory protein MauD [Gammaproteobacteria bacterium]|nr:methylamine dehydrogenase accessory protein MauD [Gammaproteobacteria bacterium]
MTELILISNAILWCIVIVLALVVLALARQVGVLHERVAPAGALQPTTGPKIGELTQAMELQDLTGQPIVIGGPNPSEKNSLIMFISPTCPVCKSLVPTAKSLASSEKNLDLIFASDGDKIEQHQAYAKDLQLEHHPYVLSQKLGMNFEVSKLPFAVLLSADGTLKSKGLVNTREHLDSLLEAMDTGVATLQDYVSLVHSNQSSR